MHPDNPHRAWPFTKEEEMPRPRKSESGRILEYFRYTDIGQAKVVLELAQDILKDRIPKVVSPKQAVRKGNRKQASAPVAAVSIPQEAQ
jgi:hypothetical protein